MQSPLVKAQLKEGSFGAIFRGATCGLPHGLHWMYEGVEICPNALASVESGRITEGCNLGLAFQSTRSPYASSKTAA